MSLVTLTNAGIFRGGRWLVRAVSLRLEEKQITMLIGPNGAGKSSTAKMAVGVWKPDEGQTERRKDLRVGYAPQRFAIDWVLPLSVSRFMTLTQTLSKAQKLQALEWVGAAHLYQKPLSHLSGGEFQRVMLARTLAREPNLLVLDEPTQGVDTLGQARLYELILRIRDYLGCGILIISHDLHVVMAAADRVICLNGHICCEGTPAVIREDPAYRSLFEISPEEALKPVFSLYKHHHDHSHK